MIPQPPVPDVGQIGKEALVEVFDTWLGLPVAESDSTVSNLPLIRASIDLSGPHWLVEVHLLLPHPFARMAAGLVIGTALAEQDGEVTTDFTGELCNMIAGRVAARLARTSVPCTLGTPKIHHETFSSTQRTSSAHSIRSDWECRGHSFVLEFRSHSRT